jgi:hypothetical protein
MVEVPIDYINLKDFEVDDYRLDARAQNVIREWYAIVLGREDWRSRFDV